MKEYVKPSIEVAALASSTPIAYKSCTGPNLNDPDEYDYIEEIDNGEVVSFYWGNGS